MPNQRVDTWVGVLFLILVGIIILILVVGTVTEPPFLNPPAASRNAIIQTNAFIEMALTNTA